MNLMPTSLTKIVILVVVGAVLIIAATFALKTYAPGVVNNQNTSLDPGNQTRTGSTSSSSKSNLRIGPASIVKSQQALAIGEIVKKDNNSITLKGDDGEKATFKLASSIQIYSVSTDPNNPPKPSTDKSSIKLNQKAIVNLELQDTEYAVTTISYTP